MFLFLLELKAIKSPKIPRSIASLESHLIEHIDGHRDRTLGLLRSTSATAVSLSIRAMMLVAER